ncbi:hypothetical protein [Seonamhaeicola marinus]|uniref:Uncharacterized protein n=1 Tax=Seonamhaeicola marinus TaxID=1912246 RepID=A0A5D0HVS3_9FLAO|nr:hypothetical protein [Seonamhaeicola marinus]TYA74217.1 hypothetical protein FUA24_12845 [Seonamhaeicola marinus]
MGKDNWITVLNEIRTTKGKFKPIDINENRYDFYVVKVTEEMMGYMIVWNVNTLNAVHISRMKITEDIPYVNKDELEDLSLPENLKFDRNPF